MALVLCTGIDSVLLQTRRLILERAGHNVVTATDERDIMAACGQHAFDIAVIGQTVSSNGKRQIMVAVRKHCPTAKVLELYRSNTGRILDDADAWLEVPADVPDDLAKQVNELALKS
jgi:CheY-like chemotaxis protein